MKSLVRRAHIICSKEEFLEKEIKHLKTVFREENGFPSRVVSKTIDEVRRKFQENEEDQDQERENPVHEEERNNEVTPFICLQYNGKDGEMIVSKFKKELRSLLPTNVIPRFTYKGKKIGSFFRIKDAVPLEHETNLVYRFDHDGITRYIGQTNVRYGSRTEQHCNTDKLSSVFKYKETKGINISDKNFEIVDKGFSRLVDRRIAEALYVKEYKEPELNRQKKSAKLLLFD